MESENSELEQRNSDIRRIYNTKMEGLSFDEKIEFIDDLRTQQMTDNLTGLGTNRSFLQADDTEFVASIDADSLKWVNDNMGHGAGDELLREIGDAISAAGLKEDAYHISGDEFFVLSNDKEEMVEKLELAQDILSEKVISEGDVSMKGPGFSFGVGESIAEAEIEMLVDKKTREMNGERAARGETPNGVSGIDEHSLASTNSEGGNPKPAVEIQKLDAANEHAETIVREVDSQEANKDADIPRNQEAREYFQKKKDRIDPSEADEFIEGLREAGTTDKLTGLQTHTAYIAQVDDRKEFVALVDADSLKWVNDNMGGHAAGDKLLSALGESILESGIEKKDAFHPSGDEFWVVSNDAADLREKLEAAQEIMSQKVILGEDKAFASPGFSFGIADNLNDADMLLIEDKKMRELNGLRAGRGENPSTAFDISNIDEVRLELGLDSDSNLDVVEIPTASQPFERNDEGFANLIRDTRDVSNDNTSEESFSM